MPVKFNVGGGASAGKDTATEADVRAPKTFHAGRGSKPRTGCIPDCYVRTVTPCNVDQAIPAGSYIAEDITIEGDADLASKNIRAGVDIFGVPGNVNVVDTSGGNLVAGKMLKGQKGFSKGKKVDGEIETLTDISFSPSDSTAFNECKITGSAENSYVGAFDFSVIGYIAGKIRIHIANLLSKNIRAGIKVGGVGGYLLGTFTNDATATTADVLDGKTVGIKGEMVKGTMKNRGGSQIAKNAYFYTNADGVMYLINWTPGGYYKGWQTGKGEACAEVWLPKTTFDSLVGKKAISAMAVRGFGVSSSEWTTSEEMSYTMPRDGTVYYGGASACYNASGNVVCEISKNGTVVDSRNINTSNKYNWRGTMFDKSFSAKKGDVIKVKAECTSGSHAISCIQAVVVC